MKTTLQLMDPLQRWFDRYSRGYLGEDDRLDANIRYKQHHSTRTRQQMRSLAQQLQWSQREILLAEVIGLLHDVGRFEQLRCHRTYNDHQSLDHGILAVEILTQKNLLEHFSPTEKDWILTAIRYHNARCLPNSLQGDSLKYAQLIRDADKLDIFVSCTAIYQRYHNDPDAVALEVGFPLKPYCTPEVVEATLTGKSVEYRVLQTFYDCLVMQLGWVFDLNFSVSLAALKTSGALEELMEIIPDWPQMHEVKAVVRHYLDQAAKQTASVS